MIHSVELAAEWMVCAARTNEDVHGCKLGQPG